MTTQQDTIYDTFISKATPAFRHDLRGLGIRLRDEVADAFITTIAEQRSLTSADKVVQSMREMATEWPRHGDIYAREWVSRVALTCYFAWQAIGAAARGDVPWLLLDLEFMDLVAPRGVVATVILLIRSEFFSIAKGGAL